MKAVFFFCAIAAVCFAWWYDHRPLTYPPGVLISSEPRQVDDASQPAFEVNGFHLKPIAHFALDARLLHSRVYRYDPQSALVPIDFALGWGPMSDQSVLDQVSISQSSRFYFFEYRLPAPLAPEVIISHSTNIHIIPATREIAAQCKSLRAGSLIHLSGELIEATRPGMPVWRSSMSRTDTGNGACELMWVTEVNVLDASGTSAEKTLAKR